MTVTSARGTCFPGAPTRFPCASKACKCDLHLIPAKSHTARWERLKAEVNKSPNPALFREWKAPCGARVKAEGAQSFSPTQSTLKWRMSCTRIPQPEIPGISQKKREEQEGFELQSWELLQGEGTSSVCPKHRDTPSSWSLTSHRRG